jgi:hypothetical protein
MNMKGCDCAELRFELKYCERCGGLWLRPVGGEQIYCAACWREMVQLPPASYEQESTRMAQGPRWSWHDGDFGGRADEGNLGALAGEA